MVSCSNCGGPLESSMRFCPSCGYRISAPSSELNHVHCTIKILNASIVASLGQQIDLGMVSKKVQGAVINKVPGAVVFDLRAERTSIVLRATGTMTYRGNSEEMGRRAISEVMNRLRRAKIPILEEPTLEYNIIGEAVFDKGIDITLVPDHILDSLFAERVDTLGGNGYAVRGRYNKRGLIVPLDSKDGLGNAVSELVGGKPPVPGPLDGWAHYVAYCRLPDSKLVAQMPRALDKEGRMVKVGYALIWGAKTGKEVEESGGILGKMFEDAQLFTRLTPPDMMSNDDDSEEEE